MSRLAIRTATVADAERIASIYNHDVEHTVATFEEAPVTPSEMTRRMERVQANHAWLVCEEPAGIAGYAYAAAWHSRRAYRLTTETTIYVAPDRQRLGAGRALYANLLDTLRDRGFRCAIGVIALPNDGSVALHERFGFEKVGQFAAVGYKLGRWIDVGYWQRML